MEQTGLVRKVEALGFTDFQVSVERQDEVLLRRDLDPLAVATTESESLAFESQMFQLMPLKSESSHEVCGKLVLAFANEAYFPVELSACTHYVWPESVP